MTHIPRLTHYNLLAKRLGFVAQLSQLTTILRQLSLNKMSFKLAVLISGNGSNLQAIIDASKRGYPYDICVVLSNRTNVLGLTRATQAGIPTETLPHGSFQDREHFDRTLIERLDAYQPDLIVLAGFMRILSPIFINHYRNKIINIHPSLLPKYPGLDTHQRVIEAFDSEHGITIHFVTDELDGGPIIAQATFKINEDDTAESLEYKGHQIEHQMYPVIIRWIAEGRIQIQDHHVFFDGKILPQNGYTFREFSL